MGDVQKMPDFSESFRMTDGVCVVDWDEVEASIEKERGEGGLDEYWGHAARCWISKVADGQRNEARVFETANLLVMSSYASEGQVRLGRNLEEALSSVLSYLGQAAESERWGKLVVLVFEDSLSYSNYIAQFYPEDSVIPMSGGICINEGYVHIALYEDEWGDLISAFVHEATHAYVGHLPLPLWMNEAIAMRMEGLVAGKPEYQLDRELYGRHRTHWNRETLEQFKSGEAWSIPGDSSGFSYQLAEILWKKIETNLEAKPDEIQELIGKASWEDSGELALQEIFGIQLDDLLRSFLGDVL